SATSNGLGFLRGRFTGNSFAWDTPVIVRSAPNTQHFFDKPWMVADSSSGNVYLTYTDFYGVGLDAIEFQRSLDRGATWSTFTALSSVAGTGLVQGSRVAVGPQGVLYGVWKEIGASTDEDFMRIRKSVDFGQTFQAEQKVSDLYDNFGTGPPGFNRERGITFPSIAV